MADRPVQARWWRVLRGLGQAVGILGLLALALWRLSLSLAGTPDEPVVASWCHQAYARAHRARDSAIVDQQRPIASREQAAAALTCGALRAQGALRR